MALLQVTSLAANLLLGNMPVALILNFKMYAILLFINVQVSFLFIGSFLSQNILKGFDPASSGWKRALQGMGLPHFRDDWTRLTQHVHRSVVSVRSRDQQKASDKFAGVEGWIDWVPVSDDEAIDLLLNEQCLRCAISAQALTCVPQQFNTMRWVLLLCDARTFTYAYSLCTVWMPSIRDCRTLPTMCSGCVSGLI